MCWWIMGADAVILMAADVADDVAEAADDAADTADAADAAEDGGTMCPGMLSLHACSGNVGAGLRCLRCSPSVCCLAESLVSGVLVGWI